MKNTSILITLFAMMATAPAARADSTIDFDGKFKPQTMHDIFANSHQFIPAPAPAREVKMSDLPGQACGLVCVGGQLTDNCQCEPYYPWPDDNAPIDWSAIYQYVQNGNSNYCVPVASGPWWTGCVVGASPVTLTAAPEIPGRSFEEMGATQKKLLAIQHILQSSLKKAVIDRSAVYGFSPETVRSVSDAKTKILYDNEKVYITNGKALIVITDDTLMVAVKKQQSAILRHMGASKEVTTIIAGAGVIIGCMSNDNCWDAVGDAVSDATEWWVTNVQDHTGDPLLNTPD